MPTLNEQIQVLRPGQAADWEHDSSAALTLLEEITATGRQWDIFLILEDGKILYEITNIFMIDEDGEILTIRGWNAKDKPIDAKAPTLASAACQAWLMYQNAL